MANVSDSRGSREDYQKLKDLGVELKGKIALAQYGGANRGVKIKNAEVSSITRSWRVRYLLKKQAHGMIGTILYTDPLEDGEITEANGYLPYPGQQNKESPNTSTY
jgi:N-acetylated-alpha-linked acidic dipeptidase